MKVRFITRTAVLLALVVVIQTLGRVALAPAISNYVVGPLVNACLLIAVASTGFWSGASIALLAPVGAVLTGALIPLAFVPVIGLGNLVLVLVFTLFNGWKMNLTTPIWRQGTGMAAAALAKFGFLYAGVRIAVNSGFLGNLPQKQANGLIAAFSVPQLITALTGSIVALVIIRSLGMIYGKRNSPPVE